jgi:hypothetical protein
MVELQTKALSDLIDQLKSKIETLENTVQLLETTENV